MPTTSEILTITDVSLIRKLFEDDQTLSISREGRNYKAQIFRILELAEYNIEAGYELQYPKEM